MNENDIEALYYSSLLFSAGFSEHFFFIFKIMINHDIRKTILSRAQFMFVIILQL